MVCRIESKIGYLLSKRFLIYKDAKFTRFHNAFFDWHCVHLFGHLIKCNEGVARLSFHIHRWIFVSEPNEEALIVLAIHL